MGCGPKVGTCGVPLVTIVVVSFVMRTQWDLASALNIDHSILLDDSQYSQESQNVDEFHEIQHQKNSTADDALFSCSSSYAIQHKAPTNINILDLYEKLPFDDPADRGEWQVYWQIPVNKQRWNRQNKLNVVVLPHSHCDPGWIITFEEYYEGTTKKILNAMLDNLSRNNTFKFIWAEMSFFSVWWNDLTIPERQQVRIIVENKQLEFVTAGWVMPDEANSHYYSILIQLFEGNQWLKNHLNYVPRNGWSIDPFGVSPTMAYLLKRCGFSNMLIQRTHYIIKKHLGKARDLEFAWRQSWDATGATDILTQLMPFDSYTTPATCGPNKSLCTEFDFKGYYNTQITDENIQERALTLLNQYQKKGSLFKTNNVLVPLGGDFAWVTQREWTAQTKNYNKLFNFVNSNPELNSQWQFGTLDDYFTEMRSDLRRSGAGLSVLTGDFFTYAERDDRYWSGYYTSRPFHKAMDRQLISHLRAAHIAYTLMAGEMSRRSSSLIEYPFIRTLFGKLRYARRILSLFQHHDGITGTSKDRVMEDYASKLFEGLTNCNLVMQKSFQVLTHLQNKDFQSHIVNMNASSNMKQENAFSSSFSFDFTPVFAKDHFHSLPRYNKILLHSSNPKSLVTAFNPVAQTRTQLITLHVYMLTPISDIECFDLQGKPMDIEILPVFEDQTKISQNTVQVNVLVTISPFAVKSFVVQQSNKPAPKASILLKNSPVHVESPQIGNSRFSVNHLSGSSSGRIEETIELSNGYYKLHFDNNGFVNAATVNGILYTFEIAMFKYGTEKGYGRSSGLYVFMPDGKAKALPVHRPFIKIVQGKFESYVEVWLDQVKHRITLYNHPGLESYSIDIKNQVYIGNENNYELMMRVHTGISSANTSYTDLNGFQMIERKRLSKLPLAANYFPFPGATFIEDDHLRMTILTRQPLGTASLDPGQIEIMMDRRLLQDDHLGVGQGSGDSLEIINTFKIMLERPQCNDKMKETKSPMLSLAAHATHHSLLHPFKTFKGLPEVQSRSQSEALGKVSDYQPNGIGGLACDVLIVDTIPLSQFLDDIDDDSYYHSSKTAMLVHRVGFDDRFTGEVPLKCPLHPEELGKVQMSELFPQLFKPMVKQMSLNFVTHVISFDVDDMIGLNPHEIYGFVTEFKNARHTNSSQIFLRNH